MGRAVAVSRYALGLGIPQATSWMISFGAIGCARLQLAHDSKKTAETRSKGTQTWLSMTYHSPRGTLHPEPMGFPMDGSAELRILDLLGHPAYTGHVQYIQAGDVSANLVTGFVELRFFGPELMDSSRFFFFFFFFLRGWTILVAYTNFFDVFLAHPHQKGSKDRPTGVGVASLFVPPNRRTAKKHIEQGSPQTEKDLARAKLHEAMAVLVLACALDGSDGDGSGARGGWRSGGRWVPERQGPEKWPTPPSCFMFFYNTSISDLGVLFLRESPKRVHSLIFY